ncbi:MBL fold metallo-hydrolase RNA specificity domain-containing protein [Desnuesiella massiliensis]|uniref:MBL fold metallo-hydrolase RNA specificity domain-containing protein n=1 Tax=Desnuesiella massiliensis TaxID=1650662 RepID=UPI0006E23752|nr:MBL fold metallo-hydrolase [Desnuesiella massiliensis]
MKLEFFGAAGSVTGSCHILRVNDKNILLDCGLFQGRDEKERGNDIFPFNPKDIDYVLLSHAHIDHSGRIPLLYKKGFKGEVICTEATMELSRVMLIDSGHIHEMEAEWKNRKRARQGLEKVDPLYTVKMAELSSYLFRGIKYNEVIELFQGFKICFKDAGHLLGSSIIELFIKEENKDEVKIVYSGDLGNINIPIIKDPTTIDNADYVIMETTYGNRLHEKGDKEFSELVKIIKDTFRRGGNVVIPSFAVGRTQEIIYVLNNFIENDELQGVKVYVDSPLAREATRIFNKHIELYDEEALKIINNGDHPLDFEGLVFTQSAEESAQINKVQKGAIIIAASGMCEAGRIKHHLKHNLWRKESSIVFVGYQAEGTLGRAILEGEKKVKIFGEDIAVNAKIYNLPGLSGHADQLGLLNWISSFKKKPKEVLLVHGDKEAQNSFKNLLTDKGFKVRRMNLGDIYYINEKIENTMNVKAEIIKYINSIADIENMNPEEIIEVIKSLISKK